LERSDDALDPWLAQSVAKARIEYRLGRNVRCGEFADGRLLRQIAPGLSNAD
jgi:hypothetical protein